jgi:prepilin-type N-terminal cleavage/methylation domain-containing protein
MSHQRIKLSYQGFTLIEILVTVAIMGVMAAIAAPSFMTWLNNKKVDDVLAQVEGALKEAQSTAIRKNITCNVLVKSDRITSVVSDQASAEVPGCLPSGWRLVSNESRNIRILGTGGSSGTIIKFSTKGTTLLTPTTQAVAVYRTDVPGSGTKKCLVVSSGIGIIRVGNYTDSNPPSFADPNTPTNAEIDDVISKCVTP